MARTYPTVNGSAPGGASDVVASWVKDYEWLPGTETPQTLSGASFVDNLGVTHTIEKNGAPSDPVLDANGLRLPCPRTGNNTVAVVIPIGAAVESGDGASLPFALGQLVVGVAYWTRAVTAGTLASNGDYAGVWHYPGANATLADAPGFIARALFNAGALKYEINKADTAYSPDLMNWVGSGNVWTTAHWCSGLPACDMRFAESAPTVPASRADAAYTFGSYGNEGVRSCVYTGASVANMDLPSTSAAFQLRVGSEAGSGTNEPVLTKFQIWRFR